MKKILITGASGFIGSFIVEEALKQGMETWAAVRKTSSRKYLQDERIHFIELDFSSEEKLQKALEGHTFDYVVHAAGATKALHKEDFFRVNTEGTKNLVNALLALKMPLKKFVYMSSLSVFGAIREQQPYTEIEPTDTPQPNTAYGQSKLATEKFLESIKASPKASPTTSPDPSKGGEMDNTSSMESGCQSNKLSNTSSKESSNKSNKQSNTSSMEESHKSNKNLPSFGGAGGGRPSAGFPYVILRPTGVYGPREKDYYVMMQSIKNHSDFAVGFKRQDITFVYVRDVVQAVFEALDHGVVGHAYFLSDGDVYQSSTFSDLVHDELGKPWWIRITAPCWLLRIITFFGDIIGHITGKMIVLNNDKYNILKQRNWRCDISLAEKELGYKPQWNLERGVKEAVAWYKANGWL